MKTELFLRLTLSATLLLLFVSCAPTSHNEVKNYRAPASESSGIIGGADATLEYAQQNGIIGIYDMQKGGLCTGSLIDQNLILTAGHCLNVEEPDQMIVFFGPSFEDVVKQVQADDYKNIRPVLKVFRHENYGSAEVEDEPMNDIGLIRFLGPLPAGFKIASVAAPSLASSIKDGSLLTLSGYGLNEFKRDPETEKPLVSKGSGTLRHVEGVEVVTQVALGKEILLDQTKGRGACHGDSGGPAYFLDLATQQTFVIGVTSRGNGNCDDKAIYASVMGYSQWIEQNSKQLMQ